MSKEKVLCPHCEANLLEEGIGRTSQYHQIFYPNGNCDDIEYGDLIEYYCPSCGKTIDDTFAGDVLGE